MGREFPSFIDQKSSKGNYGIVIFDVEGVVIPKWHYLIFEAKWLKIHELFLMMTFGFLYEVGAISIGSALRRIYKLFAEVSFDKFFQTFREIPTIPGALEVCRVLEERGYRTTLLSSGLPTLFVENLAERLGTDYAFGLELEVADGRLTGKISGDIIEHNGKGIVLRSILKDQGLSPESCIVIADDRNNLSMLPQCGRSIGYNPDFIFAAKAEYIVKGSLQEVLPYIEHGKAGTLSPRGDFFREFIHIGGFLVPLICKYLGVDALLLAILIILVSIVYIASEIARLKGKCFPFFSAITSRVVIGEENWSFAAAPIFFAAGIILSLFVFPVTIGYVSIAVLTLGDSSASIFGKRFGRTVIPFNRSKKLEGSFLGFFIAFSGTLVFIDPLRGLAAAAVGMLVESIPSPINDNISIPILSGLTAMFLQ